MGKIVSLGEIMLRLTPPKKNIISNTQSFNACYGGSEANVLCCLAELGDKTEFITVLPTNLLGDAATRHLNSYNVGTKFIQYTDDRLGIYFYEEGAAERQSNVIYDRKESAISVLHNCQFDFDTIFKDCSLFHISGISFAISEELRKICFKFLAEAKKRNIITSFDFNYRKKLWSVSEATKIYQQIIPQIDILFAAEKDIVEFLEVSIDDFFKKYNCKTLILRERKIITPEKHSVEIIAKTKIGDEIIAYKIEPTEFFVYERVGSGDAFDGGVLHILNQNKENIETAIHYGLACFILKHSVIGDTFSLNKTLVENFISSKSKDVNR